MPRSAAIAGVLFGLLYGGAVLLLRLAVPDTLVERGPWLEHNADRIDWAVHLQSFAAIAFLWFVGVVRTHLGAAEDRLLGTVFVGSALLFLAAGIAAGAATSALLGAFGDIAAGGDAGGLFAYASRLAFDLHNVYALRFAGVCMLSLATLGLRSGALPRPFVFITYALAALLVFGLSHLRWLALLFPAWVLGFSVYLLLSRPPRETP
ncbi:MAG: hypothetical protein M9915_11260 [Rhizobacter sp.]|nr:hypothetical protein [Burkholderiaceae bacterium]MCO5124307.1 hypothetical protein [Rhizobacter sp.]